MVSRASRIPDEFILELQGIVWDTGNISVAGKAKAGIRFLTLANERGVCR